MVTEKTIYRHVSINRSDNGDDLEVHLLCMQYAGYDVVQSLRLKYQTAARPKKQEKEKPKKTPIAMEIAQTKKSDVNKGVQKENFDLGIERKLRCESDGG